MKRRNISLLPFLLFLFMLSSCKQPVSTESVIVHVVRDASGQISRQLGEATQKFDESRPVLQSGRTVIIASNEGGSFAELLKQLPAGRPELVVLNAEADIPGSAATRDHLSKPEVVCGTHPAYIPDWVKGEAREATELYVRFLVAHCEAR